MHGLMSFIDNFQLPLTNSVLVFLVLLIIVLLSPIVLRRFNVPSIIVLILSGVLIGPHCLNVLSEGNTIELFSNIGLLYIMFIAGLDLDWNGFRLTKYKSLGFGLLTFLIPMGVGYSFCYYYLDYGLEVSLLMASMFATHTLISYPIVIKLGVTKNQAVSVAVGGTIITDTAALLLLAIVMGQHNGTFSWLFFLQIFISVLLLCVVIFKLIPPISKYFFKKLEGEKYSHYIYVMVVMFFSSILAQFAGLEPIIGAFFAGLALNRLIPSTSALMNRIEFIGNTLFIPFFLIHVGMMVDLSSLLTGTVVLLLALQLTIVSLTGKWLAAFSAQKLFSFTSVQRKLLFGLSGSRAAATLAIVLVGYKAGIMDDTILNATVILILLTCIVSSIVTDDAAKKLVHLNSEAFTGSNLIKKKGERIFLPISTDVPVDRLIDLSLILKNSRNLPISIGTVVSTNGDEEAEMISAKNKLGKYVKDASASENQIEVVATLDFNISSGIVRLSREVMADFIIMGWPRQIGIIDKLIGENASSVVDNTGKMVFMCQLARPLIYYKRIVVVAPPSCELENGFSLWIEKIAKLSQELCLPIKLYSDAKAQDTIRYFFAENDCHVELGYESFYDWNNFMSLSSQVNETDLFVVVLAREGSISYQRSLEQIPYKLDKYFAAINKIVVYPQRICDEYVTSLQGMDSTFNLPKFKFGKRKK